MSAAVIAAIQKDARRRLSYKQDELASATANVLEATEPAESKAAQVILRRAEKGISTYTAKVLCEHRNIVTSQFRSNGYDVFAYACADCKTRITSRVKL